MDNKIFLMCRLMEELATLKVPLVFKGAMTLKQAMDSLTTIGSDRYTQDIDADWVGDTPSMADLDYIINTALKRVNGNLQAVVCRAYGAGRSAGFNVVDITVGDSVFKIDISIKKNPFTSRYRTAIHGVEFNGASVEQMAADKLVVISGQKVFRRAKDLYDIYLLSYLAGYSTGHIAYIIKKVGNELGAFDELRNRRADLEYSYNKTTGILNKPAFDVIYSTNLRFAEPFIAGDYMNRNYIWNGQYWL